MTVATKKIAEQIRALPKSEIAKLATVFREFLPNAPETLSKKDWNEAWKIELDQRIAEMESGEDPGVPVEVIWEDFRKIRSRR